MIYSVKKSSRRFNTSKIRQEVVTQSATFASESVSSSLTGKIKRNTTVKEKVTRCASLEEDPTEMNTLHLKFVMRSNKKKLSWSNKQTICLFLSKHGQRCMKLSNHSGRGSTTRGMKKTKKQRCRRKESGNYGKYLVLNTATLKI